MKIGVLCAIPKEIKYFDLPSKPEQQIGRKNYYQKNNSGHELIVVECGLGKVNAALVSTILIQKFGCELLIFSGVAGGIDPELKIGDVVIGESLIQHDYGAINEDEFQVYRAGSIPMGLPKSNVEFKIDPEIKKKIQQAMPQIRMGTILTGDVFIQCGKTRKALFKRYRAQAIEMEGGAVAQVAEQFGMSAVVVRCLSDLAGANEEKLSSTFLNSAAKQAFETVNTILKILL